LQSFSSIEAVFPQEEAAKKFGLRKDRIGDPFVLGDKDTIFGSFDTIEVSVKIRSHGSRYESAVPIIAYGSKTRVNYQRNFDIVAQMGI